MISFDKLCEKIRVESEDAEISIQSIANKGDGVFVIKVNVPLDAGFKLRGFLRSGLNRRNFGIYPLAYREWEYMDFLNFDKLL